MHWFPSVAFWIIVLLHLVSSQQCPDGCTCTDNEINCRNLGLSEIPDLSQHQGTTWDTIDISYNREIRVVMPFAFQGINIQTLDLARTGLSSINRNAFANMGSLSKLVLDYNYISYDPIYTNFNGLKHLKVFWANYQGMREFPSKLVCDLKSIEELSLVGNAITTLDHLSVPATCKTLRKINLSKNSITFIESSVFTRFSQPIILDLRDNYLENVDFLFSTCKFYYVLLDDNPNLVCSCPFLTLNAQDPIMHLTGSCSISNVRTNETEIIDMSTLRESAEDIAYDACKLGRIGIPMVDCGQMLEGL